MMIAVASSLAIPPRAHAQNDTDPNEGPADALFNEGRSLLRQGNMAAACRKFEASLALMDRPGVRLNLANCYENLGLLSAAYTEFRKAEAVARQAGKPGKVRYARDRSASLERRVPRLAIHLQYGRVLADLIGVQVRLNGQVLELGWIDTRFLVDPGRHTIEVGVPDCQPWSAEIEMTEGSQRTVEVPILKPKPRPPWRAKTTASRSGILTTAGAADDEPSVSRFGLAAGAAGVFALGFGAAKGIEAAIAWRNAKNHSCDDDAECDTKVSRLGLHYAEDARRHLRWGMVSAGIGLAAIATAIAIELQPQRRRMSDRKTHFTPTVDRRGAGLSILWSF